MTITVKPIEAADASQAAKVWADGLEKTVQTALPEKREAHAKHFTCHATTSEGAKC